MEITTLAAKTEYSKDVALMIFDEFVEGTKSTKTLNDVVHFFQNTKTDDFPITFIAILNEECIGTVSIFENDCTERPQYKPWLASLYVKPSYRSQKVGSQLITYLLNHLQVLGYPSVYLKTENASQYYLNRGWQLLETIHPHAEPIDIFTYIL